MFAFEHSLTPTDFLPLHVCQSSSNVAGNAKIRQNLQSAQRTVENGGQSGMEPSSEPPPPPATDQSVQELQNLESKFGRLRVRAEERQGILIELEQSKFVRYLLSSLKQRDKTLEETKKSLVLMQNTNTDLEERIAKLTSRSRYVVVLIDGDGYLVSPPLVNHLKLC